MERQIGQAWTSDTRRHAGAHTGLTLRRAVYSLMRLFKDAVSESSQSSRSIDEGATRRQRWRREEVFVCGAVLAASPPPHTLVPRHTLNTDERGGFDPSTSPFVSPFLRITRQLALFPAAPPAPAAVHAAPRSIRPSVPLLLNLCVCRHTVHSARASLTTEPIDTPSKRSEK